MLHGGGTADGADCCGLLAGYHPQDCQRVFWVRRVGWRMGKRTERGGWGRGTADGADCCGLLLGCRRGDCQTILGGGLRLTQTYWKRPSRMPERGVSLSAFSFDGGGSFFSFSFAGSSSSECLTEPSGMGKTPHSLPHCT